ncbi:MAG: nucleoid-associated protein [Bacteroidales bacterium]|nr:nucleoid-associated protein [Bacteroidales bacterium]
MFNTEYVNIMKVIAHKVGNKVAGTGCSLSDSLTGVGVQQRLALMNMCLGPYKDEGSLKFFHPSSLGCNLVYDVTSRIFDNPDSFIDQSKNLARHLYDVTVGINDREGQMVVLFFKNFIVEGDTVDAVGIFKCEKKDMILSSIPNNADNGIDFVIEKGISSLDKGCLIFNKDRVNGYVVYAFEATGKPTQSERWFSDFLSVEKRADSYNCTESMMLFASKFIKRIIPGYETSPNDIAELMERAKSFFKNEDYFYDAQFYLDVLKQDDIIESWMKTVEVCEDPLIKLEEFLLNKQAVKRYQRKFDSDIVLDGKTKINRGFDYESGEDDRGKYYKVYYKQQTIK